jgi:hypothetical protein
MKKRKWLFAGLALAWLGADGARGQGTVTTPALPNWIGLGGGYSSADSPHMGGWAAMALPVSQSQSVYSYTVYEAIPVRGRVPTISTTTGMATILRTLTVNRGTLYVLGLVTAGTAVTATAVTGAFSGGGLGVFKFRNGFTIEAGATAEKAGTGTRPSFKLGGGWTW